MNINQIQGFHLEPTNMCTLKCPGCARTRFIEQWPQHWQNRNLDIDNLLHFLDIDLKGKKFALCGNYGDPIYHPQIIDLVRRLKHKGAIVTITTNGSYKDANWWQDLVSLLDHSDSIVFSVDGSPKNFTKYRINSDWDTIRLGMETVAKATCNSTWKYIPFAFNENDIESTRELSRSIGIKQFELDYSDRFDHRTADFQPINIELLGDRFEAQQRFKSNEKLRVHPKCVKNNKEHFITAEGFYSPCCYVADHRFYYKTKFGKNKKIYNITDITLTEVLNMPEVVNFYNNLQNISACQYNCPKI